MSIQTSANVDVECRQVSLQMSMEMSKIFRFITEKKPQKTRIISSKNVGSYVDIYTHTHTHTHTQKGSFFKHFHEEKCKKLGTDSKNVNVDWKDLQMSNICLCRWFLQMSTRYGRHLYTPLAWALGEEAVGGRRRGLPKDGAVIRVVGEANSTV